MCGDASRCGCRAVVTRVYRELRQRNIPDASAFDTAARIYRPHHPKAAPHIARHVIAEWLDPSG